MNYTTFFNYPSVFILQQLLRQMSNAEQKTYCTMLEHQKKVLEAVSYDNKLFKKELIKSQAWLNIHDQTKLRLWVKQKFYQQHADTINEILNTKYDYAS